MIAPRSTLTAAPVEAPRLAPPWMLAAFAACVTAALVASYPRHDLIERLGQAVPGPLTEAYLINLLRTAPDDPELRIILARKQLAQGVPEHVSAILTPALASKDPVVRQDASWLLWQAQTAVMERLPAEDPRRKRLTQDLHNRLVAMTDADWSQEQLARLGRQAFQLGETAIGGTLFERLAAKADNERWLSEAAELALANGEYLAAAALHGLAGEAGHDPDVAKRHLLSALTILEAGARTEEGRQLAHALLLNPAYRPLADDPDISMQLARYQLSCGALADVAASLAPALASHDPEIRRRANWLQWQVQDAMLARKPASDPGRKNLVIALRRQLALLAQEQLPENDLAMLGRKAYQYGDAQLGRRIFEQLAPGQEGEHWLTEASKVALAHGEYRAAAELHALAGERSLSLAGARRHFLAALRIMQSGNRLPEALTMAETLFSRPAYRALENDSEVLIMLVEFARAAQRPDLADKYARRLLRISLLGALRYAQNELARNGIRVMKVGNRTQVEETRPRLAFDDRIYTLGFQAFMDNRKLEDAWKVAASAVRQVPGNTVWRKRLAQVSEWTGKPQVALENWLYLAQATDSDEYWQAVLRLAPGLFDDDALKPALTREIQKFPHDARLVRELVALYERMADPEGGLDFLEQHHTRTDEPWLLAEAAELAERADDMPLAEQYWRRYAEAAPLNPEQALHFASLLLQRGGDQEARAVLDRAAPRAKEDNTEFWRLTADLARRDQRNASAIAAYRKLLASNQAVHDDYQTLHALLAPHSPREAGRIAEAAYRRFAQLDDLVLALGDFTTAAAWQETDRLLHSLDQQALASAMSDKRFLLLAAQYHQQRGDPDTARRYLEMALALAPRDSDTLVALVWMLIDADDPVPLRQALINLEKIADPGPQLATALGSAYLYLSRPQIALQRYFDPLLPAMRDDFLWMMNYADALEQNGEADRSWRLRKYLLARERQRTPAADWLKAPAANDMRRIARARLLIAEQHGDQSLAVMRELLRLDRDAAGKLSENAAIVATSWLQDQQAYHAERGWLWQQFSRTVQRPLWAEISTAIATDDRVTVGEMLEKYGERLPRYDHVAAAQMIGDIRLAQSAAFDAQSDQPADDLLHQQLDEALLAHSDRLGADLSQFRIGTVDEQDRSLYGRFALANDLALNYAFGSISRSSADANVIGVVPDELYRTASLTWRHRDGETRFGAGWRKSFERYLPLSVEHEQRIDERMRLILGLGLDQPANDSTALRLAGMKDRAHVDFSYRLTVRDQLTLTLAHDQYQAQTGTKAGTGHHAGVEYRHAIRLDPRDLELSMFASRHDFRQKGTLADGSIAALSPAGEPLSGSFFVPDDFRFYGVRLSTDTRFSQDYTRTFRPYGAVACTWNSQLGNGYELTMGLAGSVLGADHVKLEYNLGKSGSTGQDKVQQLQLNYYFHF